MLEFSQLKELLDLGLSPMPLIWDTDKKAAAKHPLHEIDVKDNTITEENISGWFDYLGKFGVPNGVALKVYPPFGMLDFDLKNTENKGVFDEWLIAVRSQNPDLIDKMCIEKTRSGGYHAYIKYAKLDHKIPVARSNGLEVISVYTGGLLSYCYPTPGYELIHNEFQDIKELTADEFDLLVSTAALFNEDKDYVPGTNTVALMEYPPEYENTCMQFDDKCDSNLFENICNSIDIWRVKDQRQYEKRKWVAFLRKGSTAAYSGKVYFGRNKRLLLFSASMSGFPTWHDSVNAGDNAWSLSPSKIIYYKNNKNWQDTIDEINELSETAGITITQPIPIHEQPINTGDRLHFPYDIFPESIYNYIQYQNIQPEYVAGFVLGSLSAAIGNTAVLMAADGYFVKPILYMAVVGSPGSSKTPAMKKAFAPLEKQDGQLYAQYKNAMNDFNEQLKAYEKDKKSADKPDKPYFEQILIKDSTIEMVVHILSKNPAGCCVLSDELAGFLNRMNQYKAGDEVQKWLEMWSGSPILVQRMTREENKVEEPYCSVIGGIQPGILESLSAAENEHNGFYHRFLFIYPAPTDKPDWNTNKTVPESVSAEFNQVYRQMIAHREQQSKEVYVLTQDANELFTKWFNFKNTKYNRATTDHVKGIIAKYQDYCLRFAILLQVTHDGLNRTGRVTDTNMERAIRLTEYFLGNMQKALKILKPDSPIDKLPKPYDELYKEIPEMFTIKTLLPLCVKFKITEGALKMFINRSKNELFRQIERGKYEKVY